MFQVNINEVRNLPEHLHKSDFLYLIRRGLTLIKFIQMERKVCATRGIWKTMFCLQAVIPWEASVSIRYYMQNDCGTLVRRLPALLLLHSAAHQPGVGVVVRSRSDTLARRQSAPAFLPGSTTSGRAASSNVDSM
jgi:hypothetical protein